MLINTFFGLSDLLHLYKSDNRRERRSTNKQGSKFDQTGRAYKQVSIQYNCKKFYSFILLISCYKADYRGRPLARPKKDWTTWYQEKCLCYNHMIEISLKERFLRRYRSLQVGLGRIMIELANIISIRSFSKEYLIDLIKTFSWWYVHIEFWIKNLWFLRRFTQIFKCAGCVST